MSNPIHISENDVKRHGLRFLKSHYRHRERQGVTTVSMDMRGTGGIIADGYLAFPKPGGEIFRATLEATSLDTRSEVKYQIERGKLGWDAAAVAFALTALFYLIGQAQGRLSVSELTLPGSISILLGLIVLLFFAYLLLMNRWRRYRYIYAIEQFKQYHADEQWVAIGEDVFANFNTDPYYVELRRQCVRNGMGLVVVRADGSTLLQMTPGRVDLFGSKRKRLRFIGQEEISKQLASGNYPKWLQSSLNPQNLQRFQQQYKYQALICLMSALLMGTVLYRDIQAQKTEEIETEAEYQDRMALVRSRNERYLQPLDFYIDTPFVWPYPIRSDLQAYLSISLQPPDQAPPQVRQQSGTQQRGFIAQLDDGQEAIVYDCSRLRSIKQTSYILQEGTYSSYSAAMSRVQELKGYGFTASALWLGCFDELEQGYALYFGLIFPDISSSQQALSAYEQRLGDNVLKIQLRTRSLTPME